MNVSGIINQTLKAAVHPGVILPAVFGLILGGCSGMGASAPSGQAQVARQAAMAEELSELKQEMRSVKAGREEMEHRFSDQRFKRPIEEKIAGLEAKVDGLSKEVSGLEREAAKWDQKMQAVIAVVKSENAQLRAEIEKMQRGRSGGEHTVAEGETIIDIAGDYDVSAQEIIDLNGIRDPRKLRIGQKLVIPGAEN